MLAAGYIYPLLSSTVLILNFLLLLSVTQEIQWLPAVEFYADTNRSSDIRYIRGHKGQIVDVSSCRMLNKKNSVSIIQGKFLVFRSEEQYSRDRVECIIKYKRSKVSISMPVSIISAFKIQYTIVS